jgi:predicted transposase YdaD
MKFDATVKGLAARYPRDQLLTFDVPPAGPVRTLNVDLSTFTASADLVLGIGDPLLEIVHIDFQAAAMGKKHADILAYNTLLFRQYHVPVHTIVILLRPSAAHSNMSGTVSYAARPGRGSMMFNYELVRLWERPVEKLLAGAMGTLPLAMLGKLPEAVALEEGLTATVQRLIERLEAEAPAEQVTELLTAAYILTGLRTPPETSKQIFQGARAMRESTTYMAILEEGEEKQARKAIQRLAQKRFGPADEHTLARLQAVSDLPRLERILDRVLEATGWDDMLQTP